MDLMIDQEAFLCASRELKDKCAEFKSLCLSIQESFEQLKKDWDSDAGKQFFVRFEKDLMDNLEKHSIVFEYMSNNLSTASQKYEEVFRAADAVVGTEY